MRLTETQQVLLSMLARYRRNGAPYPSAVEISRELCVDVSAVPTTLRRLANLGALTLAPAGPGREGLSYAHRLTLLWDDERIERIGRGEEA